MIDIKAYRETPERFEAGARAKQMGIDFGRLGALDAERRRLLTEIETRKADQNRLSKETGPRLGQLKGRVKGLAEGSPERLEAEQQIAGLESAPLSLKNQISVLEDELRRIEPEWESILMTVPQPPASDVPVGTSSDDNVELRRWAPAGFDPARGFAACRAFAPRTHLDLVKSLKMADFERGVKMSGTRHYILTGWGMRLQQAVLRMAFDMMTAENGFTPIGVPVIVQEQCMVGTGFFPAGREQAYHIEESRRGAGNDLYLTGTGEVGLMGIHAGEIVNESDLPIRYTTVSTCFRREAGAAGKDTAGLYRIHQFEKVEQVVVCRADDAESRKWHTTMIGFVETLLQRLELPYRLLQCCTGDLGVKNEDMIDIECWMPGRGELDAAGVPQGAWGETHSASRLGDFQTRRLNLRYRDANGRLQFPFALNNTVCASPRILIPLLEIHQQADGSVRIPQSLQPYVGGATEIRA